MAMTRQQWDEHTHAPNKAEECLDKEIEKKDRTVAFIPITCATSSIMAAWVFMPNMD